MKDEVQNAINQLGWSDYIKVYPDYSGRGMYGKTTWGIVGDEYALDTFLEEWEDSLEEQEDDELLADVEDFIALKRVDNMAMNLIYY